MHAYMYVCVCMYAGSHVIMYVPLADKGKEGSKAGGACSLADVHVCIRMYMPTMNSRACATEQQKQGRLKAHPTML